MPALEPDIVQQSRHASRKQAELIRIQYDALAEQGLPEELIFKLVEMWWQFLVASAHNAETSRAIHSSMQTFFAHLDQEEDDD